MKGDFTILNSGYRNNTRKKKTAEALMMKVIRPSLNAKENSVGQKFFNWTSTLPLNVYSKPLLETLHSAQNLSKLDNSDTALCSSEIFVYNCYENAIFNFFYFIAVQIGKTCSESLMRFNNCIFFYMLFCFIAGCEQVFHVLKFLIFNIVNAFN